MMNGKRKQLKAMALEAHIKATVLGELIAELDREVAYVGGENKARQIMVRAHAEAVAELDDHSRAYMLMVLGVDDE